MDGRLKEQAKLLEKFDKTSGAVLEVTIQVDPRVTKGAFAYEEYDEYRRCGNCVMYVLGRKCTTVKGDIDPINGICRLWSYRDTMPIIGKNYESHISKEQAEYLIEKGGTHCGTCKHMVMPDKCKMVGKNGDDIINPETGCCMMWEK